MLSSKSCIVKYTTYTLFLQKQMCANFEHNFFQTYTGAADTKTETAASQQTLADREQWQAGDGSHFPSVLLSRAACEVTDP